MFKLEIRNVFFKPFGLLMDVFSSVCTNWMSNSLSQILSLSSLLKRPLSMRKLLLAVSDFTTLFVDPVVDCFAFLSDPIFLEFALKKGPVHFDLDFDLKKGAASDFFV